jgi:hypothetical protein
MDAALWVALAVGAVAFTGASVVESRRSSGRRIPLWRGSPAALGWPLVLRAFGAGLTVFAAVMLARTHGMWVILLIPVVMGPALVVVFTHNRRTARPTD